MPKLRRLNGKEVLAILRAYDFEVVRINGSHHQAQRILDGKKQTITVALHGSKVIPPGTLKSIFRQAARFLPEDELKRDFYVD